MSAGIKRMLAERAGREGALASNSRQFDVDIARIKAAAPELDRDFDSATQWRPSEALLIGYSVLATSARPEGARELLASRLGGEKGTDDGE